MLASNAVAKQSETSKILYSNSGLKVTSPPPFFDKEENRGKNIDEGYF
jgi:hypothetical protein